MNPDRLPEAIDSEETLEELLSRPEAKLIEMMKRLEGDIMILGCGGKMGLSVAVMAARAIEAAGVKKRVIGVSRFSDKFLVDKMKDSNVETISCDFLNRPEVDRLPKAKNIIFMAGKKFGTTGSEADTWATNSVLPGNICYHFTESRIVAYSTGCVYDFVPANNGGSLESDSPNPHGEYAQSTLARERVFQYFSEKNQTPVCLFRLNYAIDLRYGILHDIAQNLLQENPISLSSPYVNIIWQGDAVQQSLLCLEHCKTPASIINVTGPETVPIRYIASELGKRLKRKAVFADDESDSAYLSNAAKATALFGYPSVSLLTMIDRTAAWFASGGRSLGKPTHFETKTGSY